MNVTEPDDAPDPESHEHDDSTAPPVDATVDALRGLAEHAAGVAELAVRSHPAAAVAVGAGAGYVLAVGLPSWLVRAGAAMAARTVAREVTQVAVATLSDAIRTTVRVDET